MARQQRVKGVTRRQTTGKGKSTTMRTPKAKASRSRAKAVAPKAKDASAKPRVASSRAKGSSAPASPSFTEMALASGAQAVKFAAAVAQGLAHGAANAAKELRGSTSKDRRKGASKTSAA